MTTKVGMNSSVESSAVGTNVRATRFSRYAKQMQLEEGSGVSELIVLIHKQQYAHDKSLSGVYSALQQKKKRKQKTEKGESKKEQLICKAGRFERGLL